MTITGKCLCGQVRYTASAAPQLVRTCWCRDCQYWAAGNATINMVFDRSSIEITGKLTDIASVADSGNPMHRGFCPDCGTPITSASDVRPNLVIIRAGTLDDASHGKPQMTIWASSAPDWAVIDHTLPVFEKAAT